MLYFLNIEDRIANKLKVTWILGSFKNTPINNWMQVNKEKLIALTFKEFMKEFCKHWLPYNWEQTVHTQMSNACLDPSKPFKPWAAQILSHNISLHSTTSHMMDAQLHTQLEAALDEELGCWQPRKTWTLSLISRIG